MALACMIIYKAIVSLILIFRQFTSTHRKPRHNVLHLKVRSRLSLYLWLIILFPSPIGDKFLTRWYRGYLISVSLGGRVVGGRAAALASSQGTNETMTLSIYDIQNQFVGKGIFGYNNNDTKEYFFF